ncbi:MAG TPA: cbb3-type cytochrome c oxidase subunit I, partial [Blastocatellia bacterium]|nr:cbb3-type cytochrome c oxidase subunit I [Blastocatellia bacterium]
MGYKRLWITLCLVVVGSFAVLGGVGTKLLSNAPPIPERVVTADGRVLFDKATIQNGQNVWQSIGGQETGSVFGHGSYVAPDWTADYLHREVTLALDKWAGEYGKAGFAALSLDQQAILKARAESVFRANTYDAATGTLTVDTVRGAAFDELSAYYADVFARGRTEYAIPRGALTDVTKQKQMASFFWWTAWASSTNRPGSTVSYTNNWPHEPLVANTPSSSAIVWSIISFILLLAGVGALVWYFSSREHEPAPADVPNNDPLLGFQPTPSQRATVKYFLVVTALIVVQILLGAITAHYGVEGDGFYGIPLAQILPYAITRTWHTQVGIFWIATSWLATGLFIAPAVGSGEPKGQRLGVNLLFIALLIVVAGSMTGEWLGIQQKLGNAWFWFGSQGYEYVDLGRFWQILLFGGLLFWLWLMWRALKPALKIKSESRPLLLL